MVIYNKDDKSLEIPNGIGNLNLVVNQENDLLNYATTSYVDEEILKVNSEIETINEDIDVLEGRIIDLENNGGGSSEGGNDVVYFNFDIEDGEFNVNDDFNFKTVAQALKENKIVYVNGYLVTSYFLNEYLLGEIYILANDTIVRFSASFTNFLHTTVEVTSNGFAIPDGEVINDELSFLNERVTELENNVLVVSVFNYSNLNNAVTVFKKGGNVIFKNVDSNYPDIYVQMSGVVLNASTMMYTISAFSFEKLYYFEIPISSTTNDFYPVKNKTLKYE